MKKTSAATETVEQSQHEISAATETVALVKMTRSPFDCPGASAPFEADVHPDEVGNYAAGGWKVAE